jgi:hypothetical protein
VLLLVVSRVVSAVGVRLLGLVNSICWLGRAASVEGGAVHLLVLMLVLLAAADEAGDWAGGATAGGAMRAGQG